MSKSNTHIIGVDPGLASLGWGVISVEDSVSTKEQSRQEKRNTNQVFHLAHGVINTEAKDSLEKRLLYIEQAIDMIFARFNIEILVYEQQFFVKNVTSAIPVAHALGVILLYAAKQGVKVASFTPKQIKLQITGSASAQKSTVEKFVCMQLGLDIVKVHHAADALGAALSYYYKYYNSTASRQ